MGTARQIITDAFKVIGEYQKGETLSADDAQDGLRALNLMLDGWANERLMLFQLVERSGALTSGDGEYTIGSGGDFDTTRPVRIESAFVRDSSNIDYAVSVVENDVYQSISQKNITSFNPRYLYYRANYPLGTIYLYPYPSSGFTLYMQVWDQLTQFTNLTTSASFPPGYEECLIYNLAKRIAPMYEASMSPEAIDTANKTKGNIMALNVTTPTLKSDLPLRRGLGSARERFFSGDFFR